MKQLLKSWTKSNFKLDWFSGTGSGGQHRNKHQNCLRLTETESGITVVAQSHKSRNQNLKDALKQIAPLLVDHFYPKEQKDRAPVEDVIRTYNTVDNRVIDHASGNKSSWDGYDISEDIINRKLQTHWKCPINFDGCVKNCGNYGCGN